MLIAVWFLFICIVSSQPLTSGAFVIDLPTKTRCAPHHNPTLPDVFCVTPGGMLARLLIILESIQIVDNFTAVVYYNSGEMNIKKGTATTIDLTNDFPVCNNVSCWIFDDFLQQPIIAIGTLD
jgi:hypothetical protein